MASLEKIADKLTPPVVSATDWIPIPEEVDATDIVLPEAPELERIVPEQERAQTGTIETRLTAVHAVALPAERALVLAIAIERSVWRNAITFPEPSVFPAHKSAEAVYPDGMFAPA